MYHGWRGGEGSGNGERAEAVTYGVEDVQVLGERVTACGNGPIVLDRGGGHDGRELR